MSQERSETHTAAERLIGSTLAEIVDESLESEQLGIIIESPPPMDVAMFIEDLAAEPEFNIGLAIIGIDEADVSALRTLTDGSSIRITDEVADAVNWRNGSETRFEWDGSHEPERIVVIVRGDHSRLGSLERLTPIPLGELTAAICRQMSEHDHFVDNAPAGAVWETLGGEMRSKFSITAIAAYAVAVTQGSQQENLEALGAELYRLRLFRDTGLDVASEIPDRLAENHALVSRLAHMSGVDRRRLMNSTSGEGLDEDRDWGRIVERLRTFEREGTVEVLQEVTYSEVRSIFSSSSQSSTTRSRRQARRDVESASVELVFDERTDEVESMVEDFGRKFEEKVLGEGDSEMRLEYDSDQVMRVDVDDDLYYFFRHFVTEDRWGGVIRDAESREQAVSEFRGLDTEYFSLTDKSQSFEKLRRFAQSHPDFESLVAAIDDLIEVRKRLISHLPDLLEIPLMTLIGDSDLRGDASAYIESYQQVQQLLDNKYRELQDLSPAGAPGVLSEFLVLETVVVETDAGREVVLSPLHPLHLWKYKQLAVDVTEHDAALTDEEREFLIDAVDEQPHVLRSITVGGDRRLPEQTHLIQSDSLGKLPVYTEAVGADVGTNERVWRYLIEKFTAAYPPSRRHLKISVINPLQPVDLLHEMARFAERGEIHGGSIEFVYIEDDARPILDGASSKAEEDIIRVFGPDSDMGRFEITTVSFPDYQGYIDAGADRPRHMVVVNDRSQIYVQEFDRDAQTTIHPLYVPKEFQYDAFEDEISISPSTEGMLFSEYQNLINQLYSRRQKIHEAEVHELATERSTVEDMLEAAIWIALSTRPMPTNPFWGDGLISQERRGDRQYGIYSSDLEHFRRSLRRIIQEYRIAPDDADMSSIAARIAETEQSGLLRLITQETVGAQRSRNSKGILGSIIAVQWLQEQLTPPRLIFSIDDPVTRAWLNLDTSGRRADFLTVQFDADDGLILDIVEVKAHDEPDAAFTVTGDDVVQGPAVDQVFQSTETIRRLFSGEENVTIAPRKEALREQLYHEIIASNVADSKGEWVERINRVFRGEAQLEVNPRIVSVEITNNATRDESIDGVTPEAQHIRIDRIPRQTIVRLLVSGYEEPPTDDASEELPGGQETAPAETGASAADSSSKDADDDAAAVHSFGEPEAYAESVQRLKRVLFEFDIDIRDVDPAEVEVGPNIVRYKVRLGAGEKQQKLVSRSEDIAREMSMESEPIVHRLPGTRYIAVDVPRADRTVVRLDEYLRHLPDPVDLTVGDIPFIAGVEPSGEAVVADLRDAPHMLVGGTTGSGKTVFLYSLLACILETQDLDSVDIAIIDPKLTNFMFFGSLPNLVTDEIITEAPAAYDLFERVVDEEIPRRKRILEKSMSVDIADHNARTDDPLSPMIIIVDEYADLLDAAAEDAEQMETNVRRIAQIARSVGIHLVIATQRPSANIIDTDLRSNLDMRAAFRVPNHTDSQIILDDTGAEGLGGDGDMLFKEGNEMLRLQGTLVEPDDLRSLVDRIT